MKRDTTKTLYILHSWVGAVTGVLLFVIALTGAVSVFGSPELEIWSHPSIHHYEPIHPDKIEATILQDAKQVPKGYLADIDVILPAVRRTEFLSIYFHADPDEIKNNKVEPFIVFIHDPNTLELVDIHKGNRDEISAQSSKDLSSFILQFHADLHLGSPVGLLVTGLLGLTLFASIITGLIIHRKILRELFSFRPFRSLRLFWTDSHKVMGVWGLLFHAMIAFTGAYMGITAVILVPASAFVFFDGDRAALIEAVLPDIEPELSGTPAKLNISKTIQAMQAADKGEILSFSILGWNDENAIMSANILPGKVIPSQILEYNAHKAEPIETHTLFSRLGGLSGPILDAMDPLHFGNFGGLLVKTIWALLGVGTALLGLSGVMIWIERRAYGSTGQLTTTQYQRISRFSLGVCMGLVVAISLLFYGQRLLTVAPHTMNWWLGCLFFSSWLICTSWATLMSKNEYQVSKVLLFIAALLLICVPVLNGLTTGNHIFNALTKKHYLVAGVDLAVFFIGLILLNAANSIPSHRPINHKKIRKQAAV